MGRFFLLFALVRRSETGRASFDWTGNTVAILAAGFGPSSRAFTNAFFRASIGLVSVVVSSPFPP